MKIILKNGDILEGTNEELSMFVQRGQTKPTEEKVTEINAEKKVYKKRKIKRLGWEGAEIQAIAEHLDLPAKKIKKFVPKRTVPAIANVKWQLKTNRLNESKQKIYDSYNRTLNNSTMRKTYVPNEGGTNNFNERTNQ